jgi:kynureninase
VTTTRADCEALDARDPVAPLRKHFAIGELDASGLIYLDGNSLGVLPKATAARVQDVVQAEWGRGLIRSWNSAGWITLSQRVGDKMARLVGVGPGQVLVADSTSVNLYKVLSAALALGLSDSHKRRLILAERADFPSDLYVADTLARERGLELKLVDEDQVTAQLDESVAILMLTHVNYRTGRMYDMAAINRAAHRAGALVVWDLSHSVGVMPLNLAGSGADSADAADFAVGCGYKYLNGGPGAPAFVWVNPVHTARMDREQMRQPLAGWLGHAAPFEFSTDYRPAAGITRFTCGTPPVLSLAALDCGVDTVLAAEAVGGLSALREKSLALTSLFMDLVEARCAGHGLTLVTPREEAVRGSQVCFSHENGFAIMQALIARQVIGDFRAPDILRWGFTPLYTRFVEVWDAVDRLEQVLRTGEWRESRFAVRAAVT